MSKTFVINGKKVAMIATAALLSLGAPMYATSTTTIDKLTGYTAMGNF
jgi:hypothetical protein